jgi:hypothetical protein
LRGAGQGHTSLAWAVGTRFGQSVSPKVDHRAYLLLRRLALRRQHQRKQPSQLRAALWRRRRGCGLRDGHTAVCAAGQRCRATQGARQPVQEQGLWGGAAGHRGSARPIPWVVRRRHGRRRPRAQLRWRAHLSRAPPRGQRSGCPSGKARAPRKPRPGQQGAHPGLGGAGRAGCNVGQRKVGG